MNDTQWLDDELDDFEQMLCTKSEIKQAIIAHIEAMATNSTDLDALVREIMKVPYSKHKARELIAAYAAEAYKKGYIDGGRAGA